MKLTKKHKLWALYGVVGVVVYYFFLKRRSSSTAGIGKLNTAYSVVGGQPPRRTARSPEYGEHRLKF